MEIANDRLPRFMNRGLIEAGAVIRINDTAADSGTGASEDVHGSAVSRWRTVPDAYAGCPRAVFETVDTRRSGSWDHDSHR